MFWEGMGRIQLDTALLPVELYVTEHGKSVPAKKSVNPGSLKWRMGISVVFHGMAILELMKNGRFCGTLKTVFGVLVPQLLTA